MTSNIARESIYNLTAVTLAFIFFTSLFAAPVMLFWYQLTISVVILCLLSFFADRKEFVKKLRLKKRDLTFIIIFGTGSAIFLYLSFFVGQKIITFFYNTGLSEIKHVYNLKEQLPEWLITSLMVLLIGPGEEIFWRGFLQKRLTDKYNFCGVIASTLIYALVHIGSGNIMLILAALVCGAVWGFLYWLNDSLWCNIVSHTIWDISVFILFPFMTLS
ncbi:MAG: lysostaphin resistance A-like protein [Planctomycetota bacterium]|jgi:membrane protease YdiL (CAAX protease family)